MLPKISILIVTYLESNQKYLDLCLKSIINLNYPKDCLDILVLSTGDYEPQTMGYRSIHTDRRHHFPEGVNFGVKFLDKDSKHILILNDDTMLTKNSLLNMVNSIGDHEMIVGPVSNCDNGWLYNLSSIGYLHNGEFKALPKRFYRYEEWVNIADKMIDYDLPAWPGLWLQQWIAFYAVLIPRKVWNKIGELDGNLKTGQDDLDYCMRAQLLKVPVAVCQNALIWHAGGVSADQVLTDEIRNSNLDYFNKKWSKIPRG